MTMFDRFFEELPKSCPFCGSKAEVSVYIDDYLHKDYTVECSCCKVITTGFKTEEEAIRAWNKRV